MPDLVPSSSTGGGKMKIEMEGQMGIKKFIQY